MHNKQFIITKRKFEKEDFISLKVFGEYTLSFQKELNIVTEGDVILIGNAFQCDSSKNIPEEELKKIDCPIDTYSTWNGRWVLLYKNELHPDACSQLGVFYGKIKGEVVISSSLALIAESYKDEISINEYMPLEYNELLSWVPGPYTIIEGINRLLPTQFLKIGKDFDVCFRNPISKTDYSNLSVVEIYRKIYDLQRCAFQYIEKYDFEKRTYTENNKNTFNIGLTAGYDSRMQVSLMKAMGLIVNSHTFERRKSTEYADNKYPRMIAQILGIDWKFITINKREAKRVIEYNAHTFNSVKDRDWKWHYTCGQYDEVKGDVIVSSSIWEAFSDYYAHLGSTASLADSPEVKFDDLKNIFQTLDGNPTAERSFKKYIEWVDANPIKGLSWADRITFEQLMGIWDGNENQGKDLFSGNKFLFNPANVMEIFALVLALPKEKRKNRLWEKEMTFMFAPELDGIPYNEQSSGNDFDFSFSKEIKDKNIILYGAGNVGRSFYLQITTQKMCNIVAWVDKNYKDINKLGIAVDSPSIITSSKYDFIVIAVKAEELYKEIYNELIQVGVRRDAILWKEI